MENAKIPIIVIDDTPVKRRGLCEFVEETALCSLSAQSGDVSDTIRLVKSICQEHPQNPALSGWLVLSDLRLGGDNGIVLGRTLLEIAPALRVVIYTQDPSWTLAAEVFRQEYTRRGKRTNKQPGLHGYALFSNIDPTYLEHIITTVMYRQETFIDSEVLVLLLKRLRGQYLTPRQEECAALITRGLSNDEIALHMGFFNAKGGANVGPVENLVSELYGFFSITGVASDPGRRVLLAHAYEAYIGSRRNPT